MVQLERSYARPSSSDTERYERSRAVWAVGVWCAVVALGSSVAVVLNLTGHDISIGAPPLHARLQLAVRPEIVIALAAGVFMVVVLPRIARRATWSMLLVTGGAGGVLFGLALASMRGVGRVIAPVREPREYLAVVPRVGDVSAFLETFTSRLHEYPVHVQGHPPGPVLLGLGLRDLGFGAPAWFAAALIAGGALVVPAALVVVRDVAGERWARRAMPFLVVGPAAIWSVTSADALFAGVGAVGVALVVVSTGVGGPRRDALALGGGVVLGVSIFLSYGLVLLGLIPLVIAWQRRVARPLAYAALGLLLVVVAFGSAGFWWPDGLIATRRQYFAGIASRRPYLPFLPINLAAFALLVGPATAAGLARLRSRGMWRIVGAGLAVLAVGLLSGMSKGEVERIWLPFVPWVVVAAAATQRRAMVGWLTAQAGLAILIELLVRTPW